MPPTSHLAFYGAIYELSGSANTMQCEVVYGTAPFPVYFHLYSLLYTDILPSSFTPFSVLSHLPRRKMPRTFTLSSDIPGSVSFRKSVGRTSTYDVQIGGEGDQNSPKDADKQHGFALT